MSWRLTEQFWEVAEQNDSLAVHDDEIHKIVQGPFCLHCSARMYYEHSGQDGNKRRYFAGVPQNLKRCPGKAMLEEPFAKL